MKRDWGLILDILAYIEDDNFEDFYFNNQHAIDGDADAIFEHCELLSEGGFIEYDDCIDENDEFSRMIETIRLTWEGHNLLDELKMKVI